MQSDQNKEFLACFDKKDLPNFHTGELASIIFPISKDKALNEKIPKIKFNLFLITREKKIIVKNIKKKLNKNAISDKENQCILTLQGFIHYTSPFSFSTVESEIKREFKKNFNENLSYYRLINFEYDETEMEGPFLSYNFICLVLRGVTLTDWELKNENELYSLINDLNNENRVKKIWKNVIFDDLLNDFLYKFEITHNLTKKNRIGAIIGRFQPFHNGHMQLILAILSEVSFVKIGIGSSQYSNMLYNPFSYEERKEFIVRSLQEANISSNCYKIFAVPDLHNMEKWIALVLEVLGDFDIFYSNNDWIRQLFKKSGKLVGKKYLYDFKRFNGTYIRKRMCENESINDLIPSPVISYLKKIDGIKRVKNLSQIT
ncbi:MAG: nicotinamide-nucleotide adenylyltransferase [Promethearchaeota archaeon]